ncbi:hypothetical protein K7640_28705 [Micromonospora sp. PLK6-60]|uniref:hypothetical protein n=1 Tax=Micromonospora sp. PLK6-60 TaxID=2873383 RepID=UPI001CA6A2E9|nr:hypothetical protein [Micromonospora sp. PLK6-60]MBY8875814.1 hypothetical protein [Micromonospora sp. PLK6-60]
MAAPRPGACATVALLLLMLTACQSDAPTPEEATRAANSAAARAASAASAAEIGGTLSAATRAAPLRLVATSTSDICHAGAAKGMWPHDDYRLSCGFSEIRYFGADGDLLSVLRAVDRRAKAAGLMPDTTSTIEDVERYYAANGKTDDGLRLPLPSLGYLVPGRGFTVRIGWPDAAPLDNPPVPDLAWPIVFVAAHSVDVDAVRRDLRRRHQQLVTISSGITYHEVPWPS